MSERWKTTKEIFQGELQFTLGWSPWGLMDKWVINRRIPSEAGLFQIWIQDKRGFSLLISELAYFGGLRNTLHEAVDEAAFAGKPLRDKIGERQAWFRFSTLNSQKDLRLILKWLKNTEIRNDIVDHQGRPVLVNEVDDYRIFRLPPPDIRKRNLKNDSDFGPAIPESFIIK